MENLNLNHSILARKDIRKSSKRFCEFAPLFLINGSNLKISRLNGCWKDYWDFQRAA
jgi:hypothetical protein